MISLGGQRQTVHFHYLLRDQGGFVERARSFDEHVRQLAAGVSGQFDRDRMTEFIRAFVRPAGFQTPATDVFVTAVEEFVRRARRRSPLSRFGQRLRRGALGLLAARRKRVY